MITLSLNANLYSDATFDVGVGIHHHNSVIDRSMDVYKSCIVGSIKHRFPKQLEFELIDIKDELNFIHNNSNSDFNVDKVLLETRNLLERLISVMKYNDNIYDIIPNMMTLDDGGIGMEWRPKNGIITISMYGDGNVHLVILSDNYQYDISSKFPLSDTFVLTCKLMILNQIINKGKNLKNAVYSEQRNSYEVYLSADAEVLNKRAYCSLQDLHAQKES